MHCMVIRCIVYGLCMCGTVRTMTVGMTGGGASSVVTALDFELRWNVDHEEQASRQ